MQATPRDPEKATHPKHGAYTERGPGDGSRTHREGKYDAKLKEKLVNQLLKYNPRPSDELKARAAETAKKILKEGKFQDKKLKALQQQFATEQGVATSAAPLQPHPPPPRKSAGAEAKPRGPAEKTSGAGEGQQSAHGPVESTADADVAAAALGSARKRPAKVDEWTVMNIYSDVTHFEEQKAKRAVDQSFKAHFRDELSQQVMAKKQAKAAQRAKEKEAADEQARRYDIFLQEKEVQRQRKLMVQAEQRQKARDAKAELDRAKASAAKARLEEERKMIEKYKEQAEQDMRDRQHKVLVKKQQYDQTLLENEKELERKRKVKQMQKEEDERLFALQMEMAEKQERQRAAREEERQRRLKQAERMAEVQGDQAAAIERQTEERVRKAQEEQRRRDQEKERSKREAQKKATADQLHALDSQVEEMKDKKKKAKEAERLLLLAAQKEKEDWEADKKRAKIEKVKRQQAFAKDLDQQLAMREQYRSLSLSLSLSLSPFLPHPPPSLYHTC